MSGAFIAFILVSAVASLANDYVENMFNKNDENLE
jgi:hypothetical protein